MKMTELHYVTLGYMLREVVNMNGREKILEHKEALMFEVARPGAVPADELVKDVDKRLRWDLLYSVPSYYRNLLFQELYEYLNDDHIDTALKRIVKDLGL